jgi:hypothetical protein
LTRRASARRATPMTGPLCDSTGTVLTQNDITYLGSFKVPAGEGLAQPFVSSWGNLTYRYVGNQLRFMMSGPSQQISGWTQWPMITEMAYPGESLTAPPNAVVTSQWSDIWNGKANGGMAVTASDSGHGILYGIYFEPTTNLLWWSYSTVYEGVSHNPSIGCTLLNGDGTATGFGPWRTTIHSGMACGYILPIPTSFLPYTNGKTLIIGNPPHAANGTAPFGASMQMWTPISRNAPPDPLNSAQASIATTSLLSFDIHNPQARVASFKMCNWNCALPGAPAGCNGIYDTSKGGILSDPAPVFGGGGANLLDWMDTCAWIDTGSKRGIIQFGQMVDTVAGHAYEDGGSVCHNWYGPGTCVHGQVAHAWAATGPGAGSIASQVWIWDPNDLVPIARGQATPYSPKPASTFRVGALSSSLGVETGLYRWGQSVYDPVSGKLFISEKNVDKYGCCTYVPRIHVFRIAQS